MATRTVQSPGAPSDFVSRWAGRIIGLPGLILLMLLLSPQGVAASSACGDGWTPDVTCLMNLQLTPPERVYIVSITSNMHYVGKSICDLRLLLQNPQIGDAEWTCQVLARAERLCALAQEGKTIEPPLLFSESNGEYRKALDALLAFSSDLSTAVKHNSAALLCSAEEHLRCAIASMQRANEKVRDEIRRKCQETPL